MKQKTKRIISNRLGIFYNTRFTANNIDNILTKGRTYIYNKLYENLTFCPSDKVNVRKRQRARFERQFKRVLHNSALTEDASIEDKLIACKRKSFLLLPSTQIIKPIMHLRYKKKYQRPLQCYYNFKLPALNTSRYANRYTKQEVYRVNDFNSTEHNFSVDVSEMSFVASLSRDSDVISTVIDNSSSTFNVNAPVFIPKKMVQSKKTYDKPTVRPIPDELLPYVPNEPIYKDGITFAYLTKNEQRTREPLVVGSKNWIKAIREFKARADRKKALDDYVEEIKMKWEIDFKEFAISCDALSKNLFNLQNICHNYLAYLSTCPVISASSTLSSKKGKQKATYGPNNPPFDQRHLLELKDKVEECYLSLALAERDNVLFFPDFHNKLPRGERKRKVDNYTNLDSLHGFHRSKRSHIVTED
ncbi:unnamed protein product [Rhizophagus irregularis]|nr:unnamed protein product [Rhizophagus irregularis]